MTKHLGLKKKKSHKKKRVSVKQFINLPDNIRLYFRCLSPGLFSPALFHANKDTNFEIGLFNTRRNSDTVDIGGLVTVWEAVRCSLQCLAASPAPTHEMYQHYSHNRWQSKMSPGITRHRSR